MLNFFKKKKCEEKKVCGKKPFVFTTRHLADNTANGELIRNVSPARLYSGNDFSTIDSISYSPQAIAQINTLGDNSTNSPTKGSVPNADERKVVNPKDVFEEIKKETPEISFENLDEKIKAVKERVDVLKEHLDEGHLGDELKTLFYLENRKKYLEIREKNPLDWGLTTQEAIDDLCKTYKLRIVPLKQYYTLVPMDGIQEMKRFTSAYKAITGDVPIIELIIKDDRGEEKPTQRKKDRDPIMVANSPLGSHLFILGAWDDEVAIVDEIIYGLK